MAGIIYGLRPVRLYSHGFTTISLSRLTACWGQLPQSLCMPSAAAMFKGSSSAVAVDVPIMELATRWPAKRMTNVVVWPDLNSFCISMHCEQARLTILHVEGHSHL